MEFSSYKDEAMQGVWVDGYKVCSIGLSFLKWVSRHGMSINVNTPGDRVEGSFRMWLEEGVHTSLNKLGYKQDFDGLTLDTQRMQKAFISTCEIVLKRRPVLEYSWRGGIMIPEKRDVQSLEFDRKTVFLNMDHSAQPCFGYGRTGQD